MSSVISPPGPQLLRRVSATAVLDFIRASGAVTVTQVMQATGLARATAISVCEELMERGWIRELENQRAFGQYQKGRPARRFELNESAGYVMGVDVGIAKATAVVSNLRGETVGRSSQPFPGVQIRAEERIPGVQMTAEERLAVIDRTAMTALQNAGVSADKVLAVSVGIAAPVDRNGEVLATQRFWELFDVDLKAAFQDLHGWNVLLENDANLAALGERWRGASVGVDDVVVILSSERFGSGVIDGGRLLHGSHGGAGELAFLKQVEGVGDTFGIALMARTWATEALAGKAKTSLRTHTRQGVEAEHVFDAAADGDDVAVKILDRLADRMARVIGAVATIFNPELVVIGGAVAKSAGVLLEPIAERLKEFTATPPRIAVSPLEDSIVAVGATRSALDYVEKNSLDLVLRTQEIAD
ncbi:ROK family transcriptional regulator [Arthrobacter sp. ISL-65]|uniref:ROK family transcriptional regulator n=1 Tax=Arthrobacter sp. ISL-65 TaxID=2819112 RepID=UPI001BE56597|nr:ROK family transcriptional regulator [Arthrobacter sp. ISL-65]MBT2548995.1 ROK family transcriptional regulator [Arthrobacter sp. ISL-65]